MNYCFLLLLLSLGLVFQSSNCFGEPCPTCSGSRTTPCPQCRGTGIAEWTSIRGQRAAYGCERCGGVRGDPMKGTGRQGRGRISCPACGGTGQVASTQHLATPTTPSRENEAEQRALEQQRQRELAEEKRRREEFVKTKQNLLQRLKDINTTGNLGLKGVGETPTGRTFLKEIGASSPMPVNPSVVDLRHLDPNKPIVVDPNATRGGATTVSAAAATAPPHLIPPERAGLWEKLSMVGMEQQIAAMVGDTQWQHDLEQQTATLIRQLITNLDRQEHQQLLADLKQVRADPRLTPSLRKAEARIHKQEVEALKAADTEYRKESRTLMPLAATELSRRTGKAADSTFVQDAVIDAFTSAVLGETPKVQTEDMKVIHEMAEIPAAKLRAAQAVALRRGYEEMKGEIRRLKQQQAAQEGK